MTIDKILVLIFSGLGIFFTYWFFLMKKDEMISVTNSVDIIVKGGYSPSAISIPQGKTTKLNFVRKDSSSCLEAVVIPYFKIRKYLPMNKKISISITPEKKGEYEISCGMNMFHGRIIVR